MRIVFGLILSVIAFCGAFVLAYMFASTIERANGGCANLLLLCEHPLTILASICAGVLAVIVVVMSFKAGKRPPRS